MRRSMLYTMAQYSKQGQRTRLPADLSKLLRGSRDRRIPKGKGSFGPSRCDEIPANIDSKHKRKPAGSDMAKQVPIYITATLGSYTNE